MGSIEVGKSNDTKKMDITNYAQLFNNINTILVEYMKENICLIEI